MARKRYQGAIKDKERSMQKLIDAVGVVITTTGYTGLTASNIARTAGLDRKLISLYFGSADHLIETYIQNRDKYVNESGHSAILEQISKANSSLEVLETLVIKQLDHFYQDR